ncbi:MAG: hypothetical protein WKF52_03455 [Sphingomicrobium sp.]
MATITKRGGGWFAQVRRKVYAAHYKTFQHKAKAVAWARQQEGAIDSGAMSGQHGLRGTTLRVLIGRYVSEVTPTKRSEESERMRLEKLQRDPLCDLDLSSLSPLAIESERC